MAGKCHWPMYQTVNCFQYWTYQQQESSLYLKVKITWCLKCNIFSMVLVTVAMTVVNWNDTSDISSFDPFQEYKPKQNDMTKLPWDRVKKIPFSITATTCCILAQLRLYIRAPMDEDIKQTQKEGHAELVITIPQVSRRDLSPWSQF